ILLVEDNAQVRQFTGAVLRQRGYSVLEAASGEEALSRTRQHLEGVDLVLTDVIMAGMNGRELVEQLSLIRPGVKAVYMSGYTDDAILRHGVLTEGVAFLCKPFTGDELLRKVREGLDSGGS